MTWSHSDNAWPTNGLSYGGDYNPEQWDRDTWREDMRLMKAAGVTMVSLGIFSWGLLEVGEGHYDWESMDEIVDLLGEHGIAIDMATPTAAPPAWLLDKHPEILPVDQDMQQHWPGARLGWCPSSPTFRTYAKSIVRAVAERYGNRGHVVMWHASNEYGGGNARCYCDVSQDAFRQWLSAKYGSIDALNEAWGSAFWGHTFRSFDQVTAPRGNDAKNPARVLDYDRFSSDALLDVFLMEREILKEVTPELPVTTNFMVGAEPDVVNYARWAPHMDIVANDHYTRSPDPCPQQDVAFSGDRMRAMTTDRRPWLLMEHSTSAVNWQPRNRAKEPGEMIRNSISHVAHGSDGAMFFQWRASRSGAEQFHSAMVPHAGEDSDLFREVCRLGGYLERLAPVVGSRTSAPRVGILFDDESGWSLSKGIKPCNELKYGRAVRDWHHAFWTGNESIEVASPWQDFADYEVLVVPALYVVEDEVAERISQFALGGGTVVITYLSGIVTPDSAVRLGGYPGAFRDLLGAWCEEFRPLQAGETFTLDNGWTGADWTELVRVADAEIVARYTGGALDGRAAVTRRTLDGGGRVYYVSAGLDRASIGNLVRQELGIRANGLPEGLEVAARENGEERFTFYINHSRDEMGIPAHGHDLITGEDVSHTLTIPGGDVRVLRTPISA
ncbi:beta-galactosidase [Demequina lutea]|uniref:Beta-galactosidase n=1 Tax=Demequina lutea TaxID=431489 RepID=A0A7Y9ZBP6_9MICO|nr:beta-galactosidase [Demequina lutea]NYI42429.1 beta-galactosidase [Demequina lutea]